MTDLAVWYAGHFATLNRRAIERSRRRNHSGTATPAGHESQRYYGSIEQRDERASSAGHRRELGRLHPPLPEPGQPTLLLVHAPSLSRLTEDERRQEAAGHERPGRECHPDRRPGVRRQRTGWLVLDRAARNVRPARALANNAPSDSSCDPDLGRTLLLRDPAVPRPQRDSRAPPGGCRVCAREWSRDRRGISVRHSGSQFYTPGTLVGIQGGWLRAGRQAVVASLGTRSLRPALMLKTATARST